MAFDHRHAAAGDITLHAAAQPAAALEQRQPVALQQVGRHAPVAPFAGQAIEATDQLAVQAVTAAGTGAEDRAEHARVPRARAAMGFAQGEADGLLTAGDGRHELLPHGIADRHQHMGWAVDERGRRCR